MGTSVLEFGLCIAAAITLLRGTGEEQISLYATIDNMAILSMMQPYALFVYVYVFVCVCVCACVCACVSACVCAMKRIPIFHSPAGQSLAVNIAVNYTFLMLFSE